MENDVASGAGTVSAEGIISPDKTKSTSLCEPIIASVGGRMESKFFCFEGPTTKTTESLPTPLRVLQHH